MREAGIDLSTITPRQFTPELADGATWLVTMGCGETCPVVPGALREDWPIADPAGQPLARVRQIRNEIQLRVSQFLVDRDLQRPGLKNINATTDVTGQ